MIFQEPGAALNPVRTVGDQISEVLRAHQTPTRHEAWQTAIRLLGDVGIPDPERRAKAYPFELSGGMRQRAVIAIAMSVEPKLLIADEPTTALDVTVQAEILDLLRALQERHGMAMLLITHDLGVVAEMAKRVMVMYAGKIVEVAPNRCAVRCPLPSLYERTAGLHPASGWGTERAPQGNSWICAGFPEPAARLYLPPPMRSRRQFLHGRIPGSAPNREAAPVRVLQGRRGMNVAGSQ